MRSGSTLLKALLATAPDVSDRPEVNFQRYRSKRRQNQLAELAPEPIVLLKRPAWFNELHTYPRLPPGLACRKIVLVRDVYETTESVRKMVFRGGTARLKGVGNRFFADVYWRRITEKLLALFEADSTDTLLVRYEDLTARPIEETARMFRFIGSQQTQGTDCYNPPGYAWKWGRDDGGEVIQNLTVRPPQPADYSNRALLRMVQGSAGITDLRRRLGYSPLPAV